MRAVLLWLVLGLAAACSGGGGGGSVPVPPVPPAQPRTDLFFGYYGQESTTVVETQPHTNLVSTAGIRGLLDQMAALTFAGDRKKVVQLELCRVPVEQGEAEATFTLQRLHDAGLLGNVLTVRWCDEPNNTELGYTWDTPTVLAMNSAVRRAMAKFAELGGVGLSVIYKCSIPAYPGSDDFDGTGCDDYDSGCKVFAQYYTKLPYRAGQWRTVVPGGATMPDGRGKQDPTCFVNFCEAEPTCRVVEAWLYDDVSGVVGIRNNGMRTAYCKAGNAITLKKAMCG